MKEDIRGLYRTVPPVQLRPRTSTERQHDRMAGRGGQAGVDTPRPVEIRNGLPEPIGYDWERKAEKARDAEVARQLAEIRAVALDRRRREIKRKMGQ